MIRRGLVAREQTLNEYVLKLFIFLPILIVNLVSLFYLYTRLYGICIL